MHRLVALLVVVLWAGCASLGAEKPWRTKDETVTAGEQNRISTHGRWDGGEGECVPEAPPRLELAQTPEHGAVEFGRRKHRPKTCPRAFPHATVHYRAAAGYTGPDRFSYYRIDPESGRKRLVLVNVTVRAK